MSLIAEAAFDLANTHEKMRVRLYAPQEEREQNAWGCAFEIDEPIGVKRVIYGESSLQALVLAIKTLSAHLYGSELYKDNQLGIYGAFGQSLSIPAPQVLLDIAPYPF